MLVFGIVVMTFGGGLYFSLCGEPCSFDPQTPSVLGFNPVVNSSLCLHSDEMR